MGSFFLVDGAININNARESRQKAIIRTFQSALFDYRFYVPVFLIKIKTKKPFVFMYRGGAVYAKRLFIRTPRLRGLRRMRLNFAETT